ncbi:MAG: DUF1810 family protein [Verrucomicrobiota bacterium]
MNAKGLVRLGVPPGEASRRGMEFNAKYILKGLDKAKLAEFVTAQDAVYDNVRRELAAGRKETHWIWFIFPQMAGLGFSSTSRKFGIASKAEARSYLGHSVLGPRLRECTQLMLSVPNRSIGSILGHPDDLKFRSSMTLFAAAAPEEPLFKAALEKFFGGEHDPLTIRMLQASNSRHRRTAHGTMIKKLSVWMVALAFLRVIAGAQSAGFLHAQDQRIVDGQGREVLLRGMGLGGWMLQEGYMLGISKEGTQHSIRSRIAGLVGREDCNKFYQLWLQNHTTRADVDLLAKSGFNSVRLPMHYNLFTLPIEEEPVKGQDTWLTTGFTLTDNLLSWCKANRMYLILDLHAAPGGQGKDANISDSDPAKPSLWESGLNRQKAIALWRKLAARYVNETWLGGYDLLNEPNWTFEGKDKNGKEDSSNKPLWDLYQAITKAIREADTNHLLIIEGNGWGNNYNGFPGPWESNLVFSFHKYWNPNTQEAIARFIALRDRFHLPIWLGESGENSNQWFRDCVALVEKNHIGWAWWPHKKVASGSCILTVKRPEDFKKLVDYWNRGTERPSREIAAKALFELAENLEAGNCRFNTNVVQALIPSGLPIPLSAR